jgi:hypothetical protein
MPVITTVKTLGIWHLAASASFGKTWLRRGWFSNGTEMAYWTEYWRAARIAGPARVDFTAAPVFRDRELNAPAEAERFQVSPS